MKLFLVYTESANCAGGGEWFATFASCSDEAELLVEDRANEYWQEQDSDDFDEDSDVEGPFANLLDVVELSKERIDDEDRDWLKILVKSDLGHSAQVVGTSAKEVNEYVKKLQLELQS